MRAELLKLPGVLDVQYQIGQDLFHVRFEGILVTLETIFATVFLAGKKMGQEYAPELVG